MRFAAAFVPFICCLVAPAFAGQPADAPDLPPLAAVVRAMESYPAVLAARSGVKAEEANQERLNAGAYEYSVRLDRSRRSENAPLDQRYKEWGVALERPFRLPGKAGLDEALGRQGVEVSRWAYGDARHEAGRTLLAAWFGWHREHFQAEAWQGQSEVLQRQLDAVKKRVQAGDAARLDAMLAEAALMQAQAAFAQARLRESVAATRLATQFGGLQPPAHPVLADPMPLSRAAAWREEILRHNHELGIARAEARRWQLLASRAEADRLPDPTVGLHYGSERDGDEKIVGVSLTVPLPGAARSASARGAAAQAEMAAYRESGVARKVEAEAANTYATASAAYEAWLKNRNVAEQMQANADLMARAYALGEIGLPEVLLARRQALEAGLNATLAKIDAAESRYRLLLDAHELWPLDEDESPEAQASSVR